MSEQSPQQRKPIARRTYAAAHATSRYDQSRRHLRVVRQESGVTTLDEAQLKEMYRRHGHSVYRYLLSRTFGDEQLAEDILQETFLRAWQTPELISDRADGCRAWLVTVARNLVIDRLRRRGRRPAETGADALAQIASAHCDMERVVTSLTLQKAIAKLTPARRAVLVQTYFQERSLGEVAQMLDIPVGTVKSRLYDALRALRQELAEPAAAAGVVSVRAAA